MMGAAQFEARDPQFEARIRASFARQGAMALIGAHLVGVAPGAVDIALPLRGDLTQQHGYLHAAVVIAIQSRVLQTLPPAAKRMAQTVRGMGSAAPARLRCGPVMVCLSAVCGWCGWLHRSLF